MIKSLKENILNPPSSIYVPFREADPDNPDWEAKPGELERAEGFLPDIPSWMLRHVEGACNDLQTPSLTRESLTFPLLEPPRLAFRLRPSALAGWSASETTFPSASLTVPLKGGEAALLSEYLLGSPSRVDPAAVAVPFQRIAKEIHSLCEDCSQAAASAGRLFHAATLMWALRFPSGHRLFPSSPIALMAGAAGLTAEFRSFGIREEAIGISLSMRRMASRLQLTLLEPWDVEGTSDCGLPVALDLFLARGGEMPPGSDGAMVRVAGTGNWGWAFEDVLKGEREERLAAPSGFRLAASIPLASFPSAGEWRDVGLSPSAIGAQGAVWKPSSISIGRQSLTARLAHRGPGMRLLSHPLFRPASFPMPSECNEEGGLGG